MASFEPMLDYCVVKMPRLPFDKFISAKRTLTTQMKATGEVMSICDNFEGAPDESHSFSGAACRQPDVLRFQPIWIKQDFWSSWKW